jgi:RTX calcium-binding nonapeptide repeat (4 copies)
MVRPTLEALQRRVLLHNTGPLKTDGNDRPGQSDGVDANSEFLFTDLLALAQNYDSTATWLPEQIGDSAFLKDFELASTLAYSPPFVTKTGELVINTPRNGVMITRSDKRIYVSIQGVPYDDIGWTADIEQTSFKGVKSISLTAGRFNNFITLGPGLPATVIRTGGGDDTIITSDESATIYAGAGDDTVYAGGGDDVVFGEAGNDRLYGGTGSDRLDGGANKDLLDGGTGRNRLAGGSGTDYLTVRLARDKTDRDSKDKLTELA